MTINPNAGPFVPPGHDQANEFTKIRQDAEMATWQEAQHKKAIRDELESKLDQMVEDRLKAEKEANGND